MGSIASDHEVSILARVLGRDQDALPIEMARYLLTLAFSVRDKERMHDLAIRNQRDSLAAEEKDELVAYARTGAMLSILKAKARRVLKSEKKQHAIG